MKIYTGTGDSGKTSLFSGERLIKSDDRIEAYGDVDELNSVIGVLVAHLPQKLTDVALQLRQVQSDLFHMGTWLATLPHSPMIKQLQMVSLEPSMQLEKAIDNMDCQLPSQKSFILPGGHIAAAYSHMARTVCRRTERHVIRLNRPDNNDDESTLALKNISIFLNRLSDYFFVLARYCNVKMNVVDIPWEGGGNASS
jgi:cob(I)alamin adenosyltransferase